VSLYTEKDGLIRSEKQIKNMRGWSIREEPDPE